MTKTITDGLLKFACRVLAVLTGRDCPAIRNMILRSLAGDLSPGERRCLKLHLWLCRHCFSRYEFARLMQMAARKRVAAVKASRRLRARVRRITI